MMSIQTPAEDSKFTQEFEDYRRACRERYLQQAPIQEEVPEQEEVTSTMVSTSIEPVQQDVSQVQSTTTPPAAFTAPSPKLEAVKKPNERRNSLTKVFSSLFTKKPSSPTIPKEKKSKAQKDKEEQDFRMARLIAELEFGGKSDQDIQQHIFHLRDQAQYASPKSNSFGGMISSLSQAFKDELNVRRNSQQATEHADSFNPFYAAAPTTNDIGYTYEELLTLENVPRGVKSLDHLVVLKYEGQELPSAQSSCAVCMMEFESDEELRALHCTHHFHKACIDKWLSVGTTCPVCKHEVERDA